MSGIKSFFNRERTITFIAFCWLFILMTGYYIIKPLRETYTNELPYQSLPYLLITLMTVIFLVNFLYDWLARKLSSNKLIIVVTVFFSIIITIFPFFLNSKWPDVKVPILGILPGRYIFIVIYYMFVGVYNLFTVTIFWSFINEVFQPEEARNSFGLVTTGGTLGGLFGSQITSYLATKISIGNMLFLSAAFLLITLVFLKLLLPYKKTEILEENECNKKINNEVKRNSGFSLILESSYLRWMVLAMFLTTSGGTFLSYQLNAMVKTYLHDQASRAIFWSNMNFWVNGLGLFFQTFAVRWAVNKLGIFFTLLISPIIDSTGCFLLICSQKLSFGSFCYVGRYSSEYSFNRASKEMLYTPTTRDFKYQAKAIIDTFVFRAGDGLTSLLLIVLGNFPLQFIALISLFVNLMRIIPSIALAKEYKKLLEKE